jgi:transcriptional regulator with XRE-family HTH domain
MFLPANLTSIRKKFRMSREDFGKLFDLSQSQVTRLENGTVEASAVLVVRVEELTGIVARRLVREPLAAAEIPAVPGGAVTLPDQVNEEAAKYERTGKGEQLTDYGELVKVVKDLRQRVARLENEVRKSD